MKKTYKLLTFNRFDMLEIEIIKPEKPIEKDIILKIYINVNKISILDKVEDKLKEIVMKYFSEFDYHIDNFPEIFIKLKTKDNIVLFNKNLKEFLLAINYLLEQEYKKFSQIELSIENTILETQKIIEIK